MWYPIKVDSRIISRHHWDIVKSIQIIPIVSNEVSFKWNQEIRPIAILKALIAPQIGQGLISTIWKGLRGISIFFRD